ncbi:MAG: DUF2802 domain-containing protein [Betaproteobacteria bacterium]|nr:DUF2802 domain-containing protein [Betaproteobacteria bacterium]
MNWTAHFPDWREILVALTVIIALYMGWLLWKMWRLGRIRPPSPPAAAARDEPVLAASAGSADAAPATGENNELPLVYAKPPLSSKRRELLASVSRSAAPAPAPASEGGFGQKTFMDGVSRELQETREEVETLRGSFAMLRDEMELLRDTLQIAQVAQNSSPLYKEAMQMAILGHDALTISERCGISRAESDLVVSLMKSKEGKTS